MSKTIQFYDKTVAINPKTVASAITVDGSTDTLNNVLADITSQVEQNTNSISSIQAVSPANAQTADKLTVLRTISLSGDATGSGTFDGSSDLAINLSIENVDISKISGIGTVASKDVGTASGNVPILDTNGKLDSNIIPSISITDTFEVSSEAEMLALICQKGDVAIRSDENKSYILKNDDPTILTNWAELKTPTDSVQSVNGKTGVVTITASDVGLGNVTNESKTTMFTSPALTGIPTTPTAAIGTNTTQIASTAFVAEAVAGVVSGDVTSANKWTTPRTLSFTGDVTGSSSVDGSANVATSMTLSNSGVTAGTYKSVTVDVKGRVTGGTNPTTLSGYGITDAAPLNNAALTGAPTAPTATNGDSSTKIATTAFVNGELNFVDGRGDIATDANSCGIVGKVTTNRATAANTINTPTTAGLTASGSSGIIRTYLSSASYGVQWYYVSGNARMFIRTFNLGAWGNWLEVSTGSIESLTYANLETRIANNALTPGKQYILSDYATKYQQPSTGSIKTMATEQLVLTAISTTQFSPIVQSLTYPEDIITYNFFFNVCEDGSTLRNGFILRRHDIRNQLNAPFDWRTMKWARYLPNPTQYLKGSTLVNYATWTSGAAQVGVIYKSGNNLYMAKNSSTIPTSATDSAVFFPLYPDITTARLMADTPVGHDGTYVIYLQALPTPVEYTTFQSGCSNIFIDDTNYNNDGSTGVSKLHNNIFFTDCNDNTLGKGCYNNTFSGGFDNNTFANMCHDNIVLGNTDNLNLGSNCHNNVFAGGCSGTTFGADCYNNVIGAYSKYNTFGAHCHDNYINCYSFSNTFGSDCDSNILGASSMYNTFGSFCSSNIVGEYFAYNTLASYCRSNSVGYSCNSNTFSSNCSNNTTGNWCDNNSFGSDCYSNILGNGCNNNSFGNYCYNNNLGDNSVSNSFGNECYLNTMGTGFSYNSFGNKCYSNTFESSCVRNSFGNNCNNNIFGLSISACILGNWCYNNTFDGTSQAITLETYCYYNSFGTGNYYLALSPACTNNTFGPNKKNIIVKYLRSKDISGVTVLESRDYTTTIERNAAGAYVYWSLNSSNVPTYTTIA